MSGQPASEPLLAQMIRACRECSTFIKGMARDDFMLDLKTQRACMMTFVIVAEIADRLRTERPELPEALPAIPWAEIRGMRNRLVHGYLVINVGTVWATASISIPQLLMALERLDIRT